jgi:uncharacterized membrane protein
VTGAHRGDGGHGSSLGREPADDPDGVPFRGLRRNARALAFGSLLLAGLFLLPDLGPQAQEPPSVELVHGRIVELLERGEERGPDVRIRVLSGPREGDVLDGYQQAAMQGPVGEAPRFGVGDEVIVSITPEPDGEFVAVGDLWRMPVLALLLGLFAVAVTVVGGWRGVRSLIALALTLAVIIRVVVPLLLSGWDPVWLAVGAASAVTAATFLLTEGARRTTLAAALGTFISLALAAGLATIFNGMSRFTPQQASEEVAFLQEVMPGLDLSGLLLAAIIFGALGILDDVTVTQAATVHELHEADPRVDRWRLAGRAMNVGRSHIAATVNTLVLAYVGASLPLIVLFAAGGQDPLLTASQEIVAVEVVRALVGSVGIVAAVPVTTAIAVMLTGRNLPFVGDGRARRRAPGWD